MSEALTKQSNQWLQCDWIPLSRSLTHMLGAAYNTTITSGLLKTQDQPIPLVLFTNTNAVDKITNIKSLFPELV